MKTIQMQSCVHDTGTVECTLVEVELPEPGPEEVVVEIEAAPINPSDLGLMFGAADLSTGARRSGMVSPQCWMCLTPRCARWPRVGTGWPWVTRVWACHRRG